MIISVFLVLSATGKEAEEKSGISVLADSPGTACVNGTGGPTKLVAPSCPEDRIVARNSSNVTSLCFFSGLRL
jgi:hypothetical protein